MQKARRHPQAPTACRRTVSGTFSPPYSGYFSPFPHGTCSLSVFWESLALPDGSGRFTQNFTCSVLLRIPIRSIFLPVRDYHPLRCSFPTTSSSNIFSMLWSYNPTNAGTLMVWALSSSFATTTEIIIIFSSSRYLDVSVLWVCSLSSDYSSNSRVAPFGNPRITDCVHLPVAYRSLSRPSSPPKAKASAMRPFLLFL